MRHIGCPTLAKIILYIHSQFNISNKARPDSINYLSKVDNPVIPRGSTSASDKE